MTLAATRTMARTRTLAGGFWPRSAAVAAGIVVIGATASSDDGPVLCPVRRCTGGHCPGCGLSRATGHLLRGDLGASVTAHPLAGLLLIQFLALVLARAAIGPAVERWLRSRLVAVLALNGILLVSVWIVRLATGAIPVPFGS